MKTLLDKSFFEYFLAENTESAEAQRIKEWNIVPVRELFFSEDLLDYCKSNVCGNYGKSWTCPPNCGSIEDQKKKILFYSNALVFTTVHDIEDSFDYEGMTLGREKHIDLTLEIRAALLQTTTDILVFGAGACPVCQKCMFPDPCPYPEKRIGSIEAAGIDVAELSKAAGISYNNGQNTVTFFSMVLLR